MTTPLPFLITACAALFAESSSLELQYKGTLERVSRTEANVEVKQFDLYCLLQDQGQGTRIAFLVDERGGGGWSWPERFGEMTLNANDQPTSKTRIQVLHNHEGTLYPLALQQPLFEFTEKLAQDAAWDAGKNRYEVQRSTKRNGRLCWEVNVFTNIGKRQTLWVEDQTGLLVAAKSKVTMGRGDAFEMLMELESMKEVSSDKLTAIQKPLASLLTLQKDLKRRENATKPELSKEQLATTKRALETLSQEATDTPFQSLVRVISRDLKLQTDRDDNVDVLAKRIVGKAAPDFSLEDLSRKTIDSKELKGDITVLHFWKYHDSPLTEPYGQVAYLDFLYNKRKKLGVHMIGVAVDSRLEKANEARQAQRDFRKFRDFMNLSYPIALHSGKLLEKLGDPRDVQAALPLWVVIDHHGKVVHYKSGYYEIDPDKGLEELDNIVIPLIRERRAEAARSSE